MQWSIPSENLGYNRAYIFSYDGLNRSYNSVYSEGSTFNGGGKYEEDILYDKMGNITNLLYADDGEDEYYLNIYYTGNQLKSARYENDRPSASYVYGSEMFDNRGGMGLATQYSYDANGNTTFDANSGISTIQYNSLNLPDVIQFSEGHQSQYTYDADGQKLELTNYTYNGSVIVPQGAISAIPSNNAGYTVTQTDYIENVICENNNQKMILTPEGYYDCAGKRYCYYLKDHLGSVRLVLQDDGKVLEKSHYYPSGMRFDPSESTSNSAALHYRYNGKELEDMNGFNQYDFGARRRLTALPIWTSMDPLAEKDYSISPYVYCANNPVNAVDPTGKSPIYDPDGNFLGTDDEGLRGTSIVINTENFTQGMAHKDASNFYRDITVSALIFKQ